MRVPPPLLLLSYGLAHWQCMLACWRRAILDVYTKVLLALQCPRLSPPAFGTAESSIVLHLISSASLPGARIM